METYFEGSVRSCPVRLAGTRRRTLRAWAGRKFRLCGEIARLVLGGIAGLLQL